MAFFSKVGGILRQTASRQINADSASRPSIFQAIRCMSSSKLFVGGLSYSTDEQSLREAFSKYGFVVEARVIVDRETGRSRGFGFVTYGAAEEASSAIQALDGQDLHGRRVRVNYATDRARGGGGFGGGGGGSYGGGFGAGYGGDNAGYGGGNYGGGGNYNSNYGGGSASYGGIGNYPAGNTGGHGGNYGVAGGGGGADSGFDGNTGSFGSGSDSFNVAAGGSSPDGVANQFGGGDESGSFGGEAGAFNQDGPLEGNYRDDDDDDAGNFSKRA